MAKPGINLSDQDFHRMITGRYHKSKRNPYDFPLMIFFKNQGQSISNKINLNVLLQFSIKNNLKISQTTGREINNLFKLSGIGKHFQNILSFYNRTEISKSDINRKDFHYIFSKSFIDNSFTGQEKFEYVMLSHVNLLLNNMTMVGGALYSKKFSGFSRSENVKKQLTDYGNNMNVLNPNNYIMNNYIILENKYPVTLPHVNLLLNNMTTFLLSGNVLPVFLKHVDLSRISVNAYDFTYDSQESYYSFPGVELVDQEFASDVNIHSVNVYPDLRRTNIQFTDTQPANIQVTNKQVTNPVNHLLLKYHFPGISHVKSFLKSVTRLTVPDMITLLHRPAGEFTKAGESAKSMIKNSLPLSAKANPGPVTKPGIPVNNSDLHFKTGSKFEHEIEEVKRIALEAKQTVTDRLNSVPILHDEEIKRKIDIKQLSDQVYLLLDRKITIEKERRGYI